MANNKHMYLIFIENTRDLKSLGVRAVWVQVPLRLPWETKNNQSNKQCRETTERWFFCVSSLERRRQHVSEGVAFLWAIIKRLSAMAASS